MTTHHFEYDIALSFAGENREYVQRVAEALKGNGVSVFYDHFAEVDMWGRDLAAHFDDVFRSKARLCVMFVSEHYAAKVWPSHERRSIMARAVQQQEQPYLLPTRFDDTDLPGLQPTIGYVDLRIRTPEQLVSMILQKMGRPSAALGGGGSTVGGDESARALSRRPRVRPRTFNKYDESMRFMDGVTLELKRRCDSLEAEGISASLFNREGRRCLRVVDEQETVYSFDVWMGGQGSDAQISFHGMKGENRNFASGSMNAWGNVDWDRDREEAVLNLMDFSLLSFGGQGDRAYTFGEFTDAVWDKICDALEDDARRRR